jgi:hypothetical protein
MFTFAMFFSLHSIFMFVLIFYHYNQIFCLGVEWQLLESFNIKKTVCMGLYEQSITWYSL